MSLSRPLRIVLIGALVGGLVALLSGTWLLRSSGGRDWFLARAVATLPAGSNVHWLSAEGRLAGPLEVRGLQYAYQGHRFDAARLRIDHGLWPLLSGRLDVHSLLLEQATWVIPRDDTPPKLPRWPDLLPRLELPITVLVRQLRVRDLRVLRGAEPLAHISRIDGGVEIGPGRLQLQQILLVSNRGLLRVSGNYLPAENFRSRFDGRVVFPALADASPARMAFATRGDLDDFALSIVGHAPAPLSLRLRLRDGRQARPRWQLDALSSQWVPAQTGLADARPLAMDLHAIGNGGQASVRGTLSRAGISARIDRSTVLAKEGVLSFAPLAVQLAQGPIELTGAVALRGDDPAFNFRLRSPALRLSAATPAPRAPVVMASGALRLRGHWSHWRVGAAMTLRRAAQTASVRLSGHGDAGRLLLDSLVARTPDGQLRGTGELDWQPDLRIALDSTLSGFDPGYFLPDYPGRVSGQLAGQAQRDGKGQWRGNLDISALRGTLRQRPLKGEASLHLADATVSGKLDLRVGDSHVDAEGSVGEQLDVVAHFSPLDLHDFWADASGRLQGSISAHGLRNAPAIAAELRGSAIRWNQTQAKSLQVQGLLPAAGGKGELRLTATGLALSGMVFDRAALTLAGSLASLRAQASLLGPAGQFSAQGTASHDGAQWRGQLQQMHLAPVRGAPWNLRSPATWRLTGNALQIDLTCLSADSGGRVCAQLSDARASVDGSGLPWTLLQPWLPANSLDLHPFGSVDFKGEFTRKPGDAWAGNLQAQSASGGLRIDPAAPQTLLAYSGLRVDARLQQSQLSIDLQAALDAGGSLSGHAQLAGLSLGAPVQGNLRFDLRQLDWIELFSGELAGPTGQLTGNLTLAGPLDAPAISGEARLARFKAELPAQGVVLSDGEFVLVGQPNGQARISGHVVSGKGALQVEGTLNLREGNSPLDLHLTGSDITVSDTPQLQAAMTPDLRLRYAAGSWQIRGSVLVPSARIDLEKLDHSVSLSPDVVVLDPQSSTRAAALRVDTEIDLQLGDAVMLRGFGLDGAVSGRLHVRDQPGTLARATGTLDISGKYIAYGRALDIKRGRLSYLNASYANPVLDILAEREFEQVTVGVRVRGSALAPETTITSNPSMATSEALSWLLIGRPLGTASGSEMQQISASSLALATGSNLLAQRLGTRLGLDSAGITQTRALGDSTFTVGKQVSPRLFVSYGVSLIGTGQVVILKYLLSHGLDVSLESGSVETAGSLNWHKEK